MMWKCRLYPMAWTKNSRKGICQETVSTACGVLFSIAFQVLFSITTWTSDSKRQSHDSFHRISTSLDQNVIFQDLLFLLHSITPLKYACSRVNFSQFGKKVLICRGVFNSLSYTSASLIISRFAFIILRMVQIFSQAT